MNKHILEKYFRDECTEEELEQILQWFQTKEGKEFLERDIEDQKNEAESGELILYPHVQTNKLYNRIQRSTFEKRNQNHWLFIRVASLLLIFTSIVSFLYWQEVMAPSDKVEQSVQIIHQTEDNQHKVLTFADGSVVRLNENSRLTVPEKLDHGDRLVLLEGEAYFEVTHDPDSPFIVETDAASIKVLGTKFNVSATDVSKNVQVAVTEGKVALTSRVSSDTASALLTKNHLGILRLSDQQITIEKIEVRNYLSWINHRLVYTGESLSQVSRQLERLYNTQIEFDNEQLKHLELTADMPKTDLPQVLQTIANTFDIQYKYTNQKIIWTE